MFQIDQPTASPTLQTPVAAGTPGYFTDGNPVQGVPATIVDNDFMNMVMMELINVVTAGGLTPSKTTYNQVLKAIQALFASISGNASKTFAVATAVAANQAVPLAQMQDGQTGYSGLVSPANGATLDVTLLGAFIFVGGGNTYTLDAASTFVNGEGLVCCNTSSAQTVAFVPTGSDSINLGSATNVNPFILQPGHAVKFVRTASNRWSVESVSVNAVLPLVIAAATGATHAVQLQQMQAAQGSYAGALTQPVGTPMGVSDLGQYVNLAGGNTYTLDAVSTLAVGQAINVVNASSGGCTVVPTGTDIISLAGTNVASVAVGSGQSCRFVKISSTTWRPEGTAIANNAPFSIAAATAANHAVQLGQVTNTTSPLALTTTAAASVNQAVNLGQFSSSVALSGYQRLPSGLIIQWGNAATNSSGFANVTLPIVFPNNLSMAQANYIASGNAFGPVATISSSSTKSALQINCWNSNTLAPGASAAIYWIAIGS
jgi:hypothetical protein